MTLPVDIRRCVISQPSLRSNVWHEVSATVLWQQLQKAICKVLTSPGNVIFAALIASFQQQLPICMLLEQQADWPVNGLLFLNLMLRQHDRLTNRGNFILDPQYLCFQHHVLGTDKAMQL